MHPKRPAWDGLDVLEQSRISGPKRAKTGSLDDGSETNSESLYMLLEQFLRSAKKTTELPLVRTPYSREEWRYHSCNMKVCYSERRSEILGG